MDIRVVSPDGTRHKRERKHAPISSRSAVGRWAAARERVLFERLLSPSQGSTTQGGAHPTRIRAALRRRPRTGESTEAERDCIENHDPSAVPDPGVRSKTPRRDQERGRPAVESAARDQVAKDGEQHSCRAEHPAQEGGGMGVIERMPCTDQAAAHREGRSGVPRLRGVRAARRRCTGNRSADVPDRVAGR